MDLEEFNKLNSNYPYLTYVKFLEEELIGVIQNTDSQLLSMYVYNHLSTPEEKTEFLRLSKLWWEDSNQQIPIDIFLREDFDKFKKILKCYPRKNVSEIKGPIVSLENNFQKRIKKRRIQLVRDMDKK